MENKISAKLLFNRFSILFGNKFSSSFSDEDTIEKWVDEWKCVFDIFDKETIKKSAEHCKLNLKWSPSIAEFIEICEKYVGVPDVEDAYQKAIRREFDHPIVQKVFNQIGSWFFSNGSEKELRQRFESEYKKIREFERQNSILRIENLN